MTLSFTCLAVSSLAEEEEPGQPAAWDSNSPIESRKSCLIKQRLEAIELKKENKARAFLELQENARKRKEIFQPTKKDI